MTNAHQAFQKLKFLEINKSLRKKKKLLWRIPLQYPTTRGHRNEKGRSQIIAFDIELESEQDQSMNFRFSLYREKQV